MAFLSDKLGGITHVPRPQSPDVAGFMQAYGGSSIPSGWLECDGSAISRSTYPELFAAIGTKYGIGDGSTTFNLPPGGPQIVTEWQAWTPVFSHTAVSSVNAQYRLNGGSIEGKGYYTLDTRSNTEIRITLPNSYTVALEGTGTTVVGTFIQDANNGDNNWCLATNGETYINVGRVTTAGSTNGTTPITDGAVGLNRHTFEFSVPVAELADYSKQIIKVYSDAGAVAVSNTSAAAGDGLLNFTTNGKFETDTSGWSVTGDFGSPSLESVTPLEGDNSLTLTNNYTSTRGKLIGTINTVDLGYRIISAEASCIFKVTGTGGVYLYYLAKGGVKVDATETTIDATGGGTFYPKAFGFILDGSVYTHVIEDVSGANGDVITADVFFASTQGAGQGSLGGWKQYDESIVTFSSTPAGWLLQNCSFMPYKDPISGTWRLTFNIRATCTGATTLQAAVDGVSWSNFGFQALTTSTVGSTMSNAATSSTNTIVLTQSSSVGLFIVSGDVELDSKPTWADFDNAVQVLSQGTAVQNARAAYKNANALSFTGSPQTINFLTETKLTGFTYSSGVFTVIQSGDYFISSTVGSTGVTGGQPTILNIEVDGTIVAQDRNTSAGYASIDDVVTVSAGQTIEISVASGDGSGSLTLSDTATRVSIFRIPDSTGQGLVGAGTSDMADATARYLLPEMREFTYTPSFSDFTGQIVNVDTPGTTFVQKVGSFVKVMGSALVDQNAAGEGTFQITLPIAADLSSPGQLVGMVGISDAGFKPVGYVSAQTTNDRAVASIECASANDNRTIYFEFTYKI